MKKHLYQIENIFKYAFECKVYFENKSNVIMYDCVVVDSDYLIITWVMQTLLFEYCKQNNLQYDIVSNRIIIRENL